MAVHELSCTNRIYSLSIFMVVAIGGSGLARPRQRRRRALSNLDSGHGHPRRIVRDRAEPPVTHGVLARSTLIRAEAQSALVLQTAHKVGDGGDVCAATATLAGSSMSLALSHSTDAH
ncbi:hypothetical protein [Mycobacterium gallinarum]|uniref:hypothetical protein n=1 Tax=Mycobacterium gallinarum TaxID=39689 RepID=UPI0013D146B3|nr:hypothetical protein [Mycobacterium gallinarum]